MIIDCALYENGVRRPGTLPLDDVSAACHRDNAFVWIGLYEPVEEEFESVQHEFELHELAVEDAIKAHQRPKLEVYGDSLFVVLKTAHYAPDREVIDFGEIMAFVGTGFIVVVRHGEPTSLSGVRKEVESRPDLLRCGPSAVLHAIVDHVVDGYGPVMSGLDDDIRDVEVSVFSDAGSNPVERIYNLKREVLRLHAATAPLVDPLEELAQRDTPLVHSDIREYFRDVHDHLLRVMAHVGTAREVLTSILEANLTRVSVRQNEDMRKISAWVAIAAVPTMVAGIYGMNFNTMPELDWAFGYPLVIGLTATVCAFLYRAFRRSGWL